MNDLLNTVFTKEAPFEVGQRHTHDMAFKVASKKDLKKELGVDPSTLPDGYIAGWASTSAKDRVSDVVIMGAFDEAISTRGLTGPEGIKLLVQHDHDRPAGHIVKLEQRAGGLWIEAQLNLAISWSNDMYHAAKSQGGLNFSIGYRLTENGFRFVDQGDESYWELSKIDLFEVSVVTFPCNDEAQMLFIKGISDETTFETVADYEKALVAFSSKPRSRNDARKFTLAVKRSAHIFAPTPVQPVQATEQEKALESASQAIADLQAVLKTRE